jgi:hypothetical protein
MVAGHIPQLAELVNSDIYRRALNWHVHRGLRIVSMDPGCSEPPQQRTLQHPPVSKPHVYEEDGYPPNELRPVSDW